MIKTVIKDILEENKLDLSIFSSLNQDSFHKDKFFKIFSQVNYPKKKVSISKEMNNRLEKKIKNYKFQELDLEDLVRIYLLLNIDFLDKNDYIQIIEECYKYGNNKEQIAILKGLYLFPYSHKYLDLALDACRTNNWMIFSAIACDNPYPFYYFDEYTFNKMVLKAIFLSLPLEKIYGLDKKNNSELARMVNEWIDEREAANRDIPWDVWQIIIPFAEGKRLKRVYKYLKEGEDVHRASVSKYLGKTKNKSHLPYLKEQYKKEKNEEIKEIIHQAIKNIESTK